MLGDKIIKIIKVIIQNVSDKITQRAIYHWKSAIWHNLCLNQFWYFFYSHFWGNTHTFADKFSLPFAALKVISGPLWHSKLISSDISHICVRNSWSCSIYLSTDYFGTRLIIFHWCLSAKICLQHFVTFYMQILWPAESIPAGLTEENPEIFLTFYWGWHFNTGKFSSHFPQIGQLGYYRKPFFVPGQRADKPRGGQN